MLRQLHWRSVAGTSLQVAVLAVLVLAFFMRTPQVSGLSMAPHIASGEIVLIDTMAYRLHAPARGDIIAFRHEGDTSEIFIKRIIGLPGDRVQIDRGRVIRNGAVLNEPYVAYPDSRSFAPVVVPADSLYVLGDNRAASDDSRFWGFVPRSDVLGKALAGIWPLPRLGAL
ncbi:MAG TPA: signal peptidase I [Candidatus Baltobacteraceae bacterium]|nr:signal peptidase I [Candidatus Baltobacteraceae bacterium]